MCSMMHGNTMQVPLPWALERSSVVLVFHTQPHGDVASESFEFFLVVKQRTC